MVERGAYQGKESEIRAYRKKTRPNAVTISFSTRGGGWAFNLVLIGEIESVSLSPLETRE